MQVGFKTAIKFNNLLILVEDKDPFILHIQYYVSKCPWHQEPCYWPNNPERLMFAGKCANRKGWASGLNWSHYRNMACYVSRTISCGRFPINHSNGNSYSATVKSIFKRGTLLIFVYRVKGSLWQHQWLQTRRDKFIANARSYVSVALILCWNLHRGTGRVCWFA